MHVNKTGKRITKSKKEEKGLLLNKQKGTLNLYMHVNKDKENITCKQK
jgi:hypothetical protein